jgi:hypothetical protein
MRIGGAASAGEAASRAASAATITSEALIAKQANAVMEACQSTKRAVRRVVRGRAATRTPGR